MPQAQETLVTALRRGVVLGMYVTGLQAEDVCVNHRTSRRSLRPCLELISGGLRQSMLISLLASYEQEDDQAEETCQIQC